MSLQDKIKKIINVIQNTNIEEIEISSFWGAQKIRLSKKTSVNQSNIPINSDSSNDQVSDDKTIVVEDSSKEDRPEHNKSTQTPVKNDVQEDKPIDDTPAIEENLEYQKAPLVGTFYASSKPEEPPFVKVGDKVSKGQIICIIEAMKIFNEIESDFDGIIIEILAEDSNPVEFNQSIFSIKPNE